MRRRIIFYTFLLFFSFKALAFNEIDNEEIESASYEIDASPFAAAHSPLPQYIDSHTEKLILIDPNEHAYGAYDKNGRLIRWGIATAGRDWCDDIESSCRTQSGQFRIYSLGDVDCISTKYPLPEGGAPMPYCMYFNGGQAIHGSDEVVYDNASHGCVRVHVSDAEWLRYSFIEGPNVSNHYRGTKVVVRPYHKDEI